MPRKGKKYHFIYKTTNILSGKYYIGMHSTDNLEDGYMGSGKRLRYSLRKYGKENHVRKILEFFDSREELVKREQEIVTLNEIAKEECMNLRVGGEGGSDCVHINSKGLNNKINQCALGGKAIANKRKNNDNLDRIYRELASKTIKETHKKGKIRYGTFKGKKHSDDSKQKMREAKLGKKLKSENSQYGTMWITNGIENKKIKKEDIIPEGWYKGRIRRSNLLEN